MTGFIRRPYTPVAIVCAVLHAAPGHAAAPDTSLWKCESCPFERGVRSDYEAGAGHVSDDAARFGNANGFDKQGGFVVLEADGGYSGEHVRLSWLLEDIGLDSRHAKIEASLPGTLDISVAYRGLPYRRFDSTDTLFVSTANGLVLPDGWTRSAITSGFDSVGANLIERDIQGDRDVIKVAASYQPTTPFELFLDYRHQAQAGVDEFGGASFTQAVLLPRPFEYETREVDAGVRYRGERGFAQFGFYGSFFRNQNASLVWENPFSSLPGAERSTSAEPPDNQFGQVSFRSGYRFSRTTRAVLSAAFGKMTQDEALLPYTINPDISLAALPRARLDGEVNTTNLHVEVSAKPMAPVNIRLSYRFDERDNQTPRDTWSRVIVDALTSGASETNRPYSFKRARFGATGDWKVLHNLTLGAAFERQEFDRDLQEVAGQTEDSGWGRIRWRPNSYIEFRGRAGTAKRAIDRYNTGVAQSFGQNPLLRKYNLAHRFREFGELTISASLPRTPVTLSAMLALADDDYSKSVLGLLASEERRYALDLGWSLSNKAQLYVNLGQEKVAALQAGSRSFATPDWWAHHDDEFASLGIGIALEQVVDRIDLTIDYTHGVGSSAIAPGAAGSLALAFPDLDSTLNSLRLSATYQHSERMRWFSTLRFEAFEADDWALEGVAPATVPTVLSLGANPYDYNLFVLKLGFRYNVGGKPPGE